MELETGGIILSLPFHTSEDLGVNLFGPDQVRKWFCLQFVFLGASGFPYGTRTSCPAPPNCIRLIPGSFPTASVQLVWPVCMAFRSASLVGDLLGGIKGRYTGFSNLSHENHHLPAAGFCQN